EALPVMETIPGPSTEALAARCRELNVHVIVGLLEEEGGKFYNSAAFVGPQGLVGKHRKLHLPNVGVDRFVNRGDLPPSVYETEIGRIGMGICYDSAFPEHARVLALQGADLIVNITNGPEGAEFCVEHTALTRARENHVYYAAINRTGEERGVTFFGQSKIVRYDGAPLAEGKPYAEDILYAEIEPALARDKRLTLASGECVSDVFKDRRPEFYGILTRR
ncbi:MAG: carbon-nitrogen hydrolase family protein, partial [Amphiplicatus sp.]